MSAGDPEIGNRPPARCPDIALGIGRILDATRHMPPGPRLDRFCLSVAKQSVGAECGLIGQFDGRLACSDEMPFSPQQWQSVTRLPLKRSPSPEYSLLDVCREIMRTGQPLRTAMEPSTSQCRWANAQTAYLGVPLKQRDLTIGLVILGSRSCAFQQSHLDALTTLMPVIEFALRRERGKGDEENAQAQLLAELDRQRRRSAELQNRLRNILALVRSVFARTVARGGSLDDILDHFSGRLDALARAQLALVNTQGRAQLDELLRGEMLSAGLADSPALRIDGPPVALSATMTEYLALAIHELTTNALKFGALKTTSARLEISWTITDGKDRRKQLTLNWHEHGVPIVPVHPARGFGSELIEEALPYRIDAKTSLAFRGGGICCTISIPLEE